MSAQPDTSSKYIMITTRQTVTAIAVIVLLYAAHVYWLLNYASPEWRRFFFWPFI